MVAMRRLYVTFMRTLPVLLYFTSYGFLLNYLLFSLFRLRIFNVSPVYCPSLFVFFLRFALSVMGPTAR